MAELGKEIQLILQDDIENGKEVGRESPKEESEAKGAFEDDEVAVVEDIDEKTVKESVLSNSESKSPSKEVKGPSNNKKIIIGRRVKSRQKEDLEEIEESVKEVEVLSVTKNIPEVGARLTLTRSALSEFSSDEEIESSQKDWRHDA